MGYADNRLSGLGVGFRDTLLRMPAPRATIEERPSGSAGLTQHEGERIIRAFARRLRAQLLLMVPLLLGLALISRHGAELVPVLPRSQSFAAGTLLVLAVCFLSFMNWRCPACHEHLRKALYPRFCPYCQVPLRGLSLPKLWALAADGVMTRCNFESFDRLAFRCGVRRSRECLKQWWSIDGRAAAEETRRWLETCGHRLQYRRILQEPDSGVPAPAVHPSAFLAWDLTRLINVARWAYTARYIDEATAWRWILTAARQLEAAFHSWAELGRDFCLGYMLWSGEKVLPEDIQGAQEWLNSASDSPWQTLPWKLSLPHTM
ncbi:MAG: DUF1266 domain-containing protein [Planctomycetota bacterium]